MGVKGLWQYVEHHHITYQPPKDTDHVPPHSGLAYALRPQHLLLDMNAILHTSYRASHPTSKATLQAVKARVQDILRRIQPSETLVVVFDGVAPVAKLVEQKERRKGLPAAPPKPAPKPSPPFTSSAEATLFTCDYEHTEVPLSQEHITAGSEFVFACERVLFAFLSSNKVTPTWKRLVLSSCTEAGEGEVKIARCLRRQWQHDAAGGVYNPDDAFTIVGNDSDLVLVSLAATPYRYFTLVDPDDFTMTCLSELLDHWSRAVPNPPLAADLLPSWRLDFVFIMLLSGCDYYDGVRSHAVELWRRYRDLRGNHGFFRRSLLSGEDFTLDVSFLRRLTEKTKSFMPQGRRGGGRRPKGGPHRRTQQQQQQQGGGRHGAAGSVTQGTELLKAALWNFKGYVLGRCVDYAYISPIKRAGEIPLGALRAAAEKPGIASAMGAGSAQTNTQGPPSPASHPVVTASTTSGDGDAGMPTSSTPLLSALEQCLAVLGVRSRYSKELLLTLESFAEDKGLKLTTSQSTRYLIDAVRDVVAHADVRRLSGAEQALLSVHSRTASGGDAQTDAGRGKEAPGADAANAGEPEENEAAFMAFARIRPKTYVKPERGGETAAGATEESKEGSCSGDGTSSVEDLGMGNEDVEIASEDAGDS